MKIYKITNLINNKIYIGKTHKTIEERWKRHICDAYRDKSTNIPLRRAILKYGETNFKIDELDDTNDSNLLNEKEIYWINYFNSTDRNIGYNATKGGDGNNTYEFKTSEELDVIRDKIRKSKQGCKNPNAKCIKCLNTQTNEEIIFETLAECQQFFNEIGHGFISRRCMGITKYLYKGIWNFAYYDSEYFNLPSKRSYNRSKPIEVWIDNKWIRFVSISDFVRTQENLKIKQFCKALQKTQGKEKKVLGFLVREDEKCVSTMADECKPVGLGMSTNSEREATLLLNNVEDIVSANSDVRKHV